MSIEEQRNAALEAREALFNVRAGDVLKTITQTGGSVLARGWQGGWITAAVEPSTVVELRKRTDLRNVLDRSDQSGGFQSWGLGDTRANNRIDLDRFHAQGFVGETSNPNRHAYGDITVAVFDSELEDEACAFFDGCESGSCGAYAGCSGSSRIKERLECEDLDGDLDYCEPVSDFTGILDDSSASPHGTFVASIILGDYEDHQGRGQSLSDPAWTGGDHSPAWEVGHTGMAPEASLIMLAGTKTVAWWEAFLEAASRHPDVINFSAGLFVDGDVCDLQSSNDWEVSTEIAFDDGAFVTAAAGNAVADNSVCSMLSPADVPKVFAVTAFDTSLNGCDANTLGCKRNPYYSAGGLDAKTPNGVVHSRAVSAIALAGPSNYIEKVTSPAGIYGNAEALFSGTSAATPVVAGAAAILKDQYISGGSTWINDPGRLFPIMLAMSDRTYEDGAGTLLRRTVGSDPKYGLGRLRMRLLGTGGGLGAFGYGHVCLELQRWVPKLRRHTLAIPNAHGNRGDEVCSLSG